jgi:hypothetical protein
MPAAGPQFAVKKVLRDCTDTAGEVLRLSSSSNHTRPPSAEETSLDSIKCADCGLVSWADAETCKRCGVQLQRTAAVETSPKFKSDGTEANYPVPLSALQSRPGRNLRIVFCVLILVSLLVGFIAFKAPREGRPQTFTLTDGSNGTSLTWFRSWLSADPSSEEIFAQYLKVSGWQANPSTLKTYVAKGTLVAENFNHVRTDLVSGDLELEGSAPNKLLFTQKFNYGAATLQHGTNGTTAWWKSVRVKLDYYHQPTTVVSIGDVLGVNQITDFKRGADYINYFQLPNTYPRLYLSGKTVVGDRVAYVLENKGRLDDAATTMYFDVETGMLLRFDCYRHAVPFREVYGELIYYDPTAPSEIYLEDYREVNGLKLPFRIRQKYREMWWITTITELTANPTVDESIFEKPAS